MNAWKLGGDFPMDQLVRFGSLVELDLSNNPDMAGDLKDMFDGLASIKSLQAGPRPPAGERDEFSTRIWVQRQAIPGRLTAGARPHCMNQKSDKTAMTHVVRAKAAGAARRSSRTAHQPIGAPPRSVSVYQAGVSV